nr:protein kinase-like domain-containing protein [Tanacetum cinerariifolium]
MNSPQEMIFSSSSSLTSFLFYGLAITCLTSATVSASYGGNETDYLALLSFKSKITQDPYNVLTSWNHSFHFCEWSGVSCGKRHKRVTALKLNSQGLEGLLSPHVGNVRFLRDLYLRNNSFQGTIPHELGRLSRLGHLYLNQNKFSGVIPTNLSGCSNLEKLHLGLNKLVGSIPKEMSFLSKLSLLVIEKNKLTGGIPPFLGNITSMEVFSVVENPLGGRIPDTFGLLKSLTGFGCGLCNLYGSIPHSIFNLSLLVNLSLSENHLTGSLPSEIGIQLPNLEFLQLWDNELTGVLPASISNCSKLEYLEMCGNNFSGKLTIDFSKLRDINNNLHGRGEADDMKFISSMKNCTKLGCQPSQSSGNEPFLKVSYNELLKATNGFAAQNLIGEGGLSSVYKGILDFDDKKFVAVKVLHLQNRGAHKSFLAECEAWRNIRHRNLLNIITSCSSVDFQRNDFKALVYEYMPNASVHDWLHSSANTLKLNLLQRVNILNHVATALDYLHNRCQTTIVHGYLKPRNILLDEDMVAHVGDFGLARLLGTDLYQNSSTGVKGTIGYAPPEYGIRSEMTSSGGVYSFGILLLELMAGKKPTDDMFNEGLCIHKLASMALPDHVTDVIDDDAIVLRSTEANAKKVEECLVATIKIGVSCSVDSPPQRMKIEIVVIELQRILDVLQNI